MEDLAPSVLPVLLVIPMLALGLFFGIFGYKYYLAIAYIQATLMFAAIGVGIGFEMDSMPMAMAGGIAGALLGFASAKFWLKLGTGLWCAMAGGMFGGLLLMLAGIHPLWGALGSALVCGLFGLIFTRVSLIIITSLGGALFFGVSSSLIIHYTGLYEVKNLWMPGAPLALVYWPILAWLQYRYTSPKEAVDGVAGFRERAAARRKQRMSTGKRYKTKPPIPIEEPGGDPESAESQ